MTPFTLAKTFADLANDPSWPDDHHLAVTVGMMIGRLKLEKARLALLVVEVAQESYWKRKTGPDPVLRSDRQERFLLEDVLSRLKVNPYHYAKVKERVGEAEVGK